MSWSVTDDRRSTERRPLGEVAYERMLDMIIRGDLGAGDALPESRLAETLGTSRVPVREALQRLAEEGWIVRKPHSGARVRVPTRRDIDEVYDLRVVLECEAVRLASRLCSLADSDRLRELIAAGRAAAEAQDDRGVVDANSAFHRGIAALSENSLLVQMLQLLDRRGRWLFAAVAKSRAPHSLSEHEDIVQALTDRDVDRAVELTRMHVEHTRSALLRHWAEREDAPDPLVAAHA